ncbi:MAG: type II toxin-antitoxin system VapC family toxin [Kineosporiaceae bacterium]
MILVDTTIWVDHLRSGHPILVRMLERSAVLGHPWVAGEIGLGSLSRREEVLGLLRALPPAQVATNEEIDVMIEAHRLFGIGIGYVHAGLLAATLLTPDARLWTRDRRLAAAARRLAVAGGPDAASG